MVAVWKHLNWKYEVNKDPLVKYKDKTRRGHTNK